MRSSMSRVGRVTVVLLFVAATAAWAADGPAVPSLEAISANHLLLRQYLQAMPKGGDLHNHLSGAVYAESYLNWADADGLCIDKVKLAIVPCPPPSPPSSDPPRYVPGSVVFTDATLYGQLLDAMSMRQFRPGAESGHDHFFATFGKFGTAARNRVPDMLAEDVSRLAGENVDYLETTFALDRGKAKDLATLVTAGASFADMRNRLLQADAAPPVVSYAKAFLDEIETGMRAGLHCGTPSAQPGCQSTIRYIYELQRGIPREQLFAQMVVAYELASADPRVVGANPVMPEDGYISMHDFDEQMRMFAFFHQLYPKVHLTTHAGELVLGLVPPDGLRNHIRDSVLVAHAERIGHGVDIPYEIDAIGLMKTMASHGVAVEVCLTSNDVILGVSGRNHPLKMYLAYGVPVALATDDPGVSRDDMTNQYMRAVEDQGLQYKELVRIARNSLEYSFAEGESLWRNHDYSAPAAPCTDDAASGKPGSRCSEFLAKNTKARIEWRLEQRLKEFEASVR